MNDYCDRPANYIFINITVLDLQEMQQFPIHVKQNGLYTIISVSGRHDDL